MITKPITFPATESRDDKELLEKLRSMHQEVIQLSARLRELDQVTHSMAYVLARIAMARGDLDALNAVIDTFIVSHDIQVDGAVNRSMH